MLPAHSGAGWGPWPRAVTQTVMCAAHGVRVRRPWGGGGAAHGGSGGRSRGRPARSSRLGVDAAPGVGFGSVHDPVALSYL